MLGPVLDLCSGPYDACADARHDIFSQLGTHNGKLVGFALACGACFTFADVFLQQVRPYHYHSCLAVKALNHKRCLTCSQDPWQTKPCRAAT